MRMVLLAIALIGWGGAASAENGWQRLSGKAVGAALASRTLGFGGNDTIGFFSDGRALRGWVWGRWWVEGDLACIDWHDQALRCYALARRGIDIKFLHPEAVMQGRYIDLN